MSYETYKYPVAIIIGCLLIATSLFLIQVIKQDSIETQADNALTVKTKIETEKLAFDKKVYETEKTEKLQKEIDLSDCLTHGDTLYSDWIELNGTDIGDEIYRAPQRTWDEAQKRREDNNDTCFKTFK